MDLINVYVGLGGNIGDSRAVLSEAIKKIQNLSDVYNLEVSRYYRTSPVSPIPQDSYINAVCRFQTRLSARDLLKQLQEIEKSLGKIEKHKDAPRIIDLDILFYGTEVYKQQDLEIPHPRWQKRLFVLVPLADLIETLMVPDLDNPHQLKQVNIKKCLQGFSSEETVIPL